MKIAICLCIWMAMVVGNKAHFFDVKKFGAKADGECDDSKAIMKAWSEACNISFPSVLVFPKGNYMVSSLSFKGPCKCSSMTIQATGANFKASSHPGKLFKSQTAWISFENIDAFRLIGGKFDGQGAQAWAANDCSKTGKCNSFPYNLFFSKITNARVQDITSLDSKLFHMHILGCKNVTFHRTTITAPEHSLNTDGIHVGRSSQINITGANIKTGDDCVSLGDGCRLVNIEKVGCGPGHGIAIGSLGKYAQEEPVIGVTVRNCTISNTMNGVRIKTWPGSRVGIARDLHFEDIVMNNVSTPILIDQEYCPYGKCKAEVPSRIKISNVFFKNIRGTSANKCAVRLACSKGVPCQNVELSDINLEYNGGDGKATSECANVIPKLTGTLFPGLSGLVDQLKVLHQFVENH